MPPPAHTPVAAGNHPLEHPSSHHPSSSSSGAIVSLPQSLLDHIDLTNRILSLVDTTLTNDFNQPNLFLSDLDQLAAQVRSELARVRSHLEEIKLQIDDLHKSRERKAALGLVHKLESHLLAATQSYRAAVLASKRRINGSSHLNAREQLFQSNNSRPSSPFGRSENQSGDDALMNATSDVTEGLRKTMQLMQEQLDQSLVSNDILQQSTATMEMTSNQYSTFSTLLTTSKALITSLERADVLDRLLLLFAFIFFCLCCAFIVKRRVVDRGLRVASALSRVVARRTYADSGENWVTISMSEAKEKVESIVGKVTGSAAAATTTLASSFSFSLPKGRIGHHHGRQYTIPPIAVPKAAQTPFSDVVVEQPDTPLASPTNAIPLPSPTPSVAPVEPPSPLPTTPPHHLDNFFDDDDDEEDLLDQQLNMMNNKHDFIAAAPPSPATLDPPSTPIASPTRIPHSEPPLPPVETATPPAEPIFSEEEEELDPELDANEAQEEHSGTIHAAPTAVPEEEVLLEIPTTTLVGDELVAEETEVPPTAQPEEGVDEIVEEPLETAVPAPFVVGSRRTRVHIPPPPSSKDDLEEFASPPLVDYDAPPFTTDPEAESDPLAEYSSPPFVDYDAPPFAGDTTIDLDDYASPPFVPDGEGTPDPLEDYSSPPFVDDSQPFVEEPVPFVPLTEELLSEVPTVSSDDFFVNDEEDLESTPIRSEDIVEDFAPLDLEEEPIKLEDDEVTESGLEGEDEEFVDAQEGEEELDLPKEDSASHSTPAEDLVLDSFSGLEDDEAVVLDEDSTAPFGTSIPDELSLGDEDEPTDGDEKIFHPEPLRKAPPYVDPQQAIDDNVVDHPPSTDEADSELEGEEDIASEILEEKGEVEDLPEEAEQWSKGTSSAVEGDEVIEGSEEEKLEPVSLEEEDEEKHAHDEL